MISLCAIISMCESKLLLIFRDQLLEVECIVAYVDLAMDHHMQEEVKVWWEVQVKAHHMVEEAVNNSLVAVGLGNHKVQEGE